MLTPFWLAGVCVLGGGIKGGDFGILQGEIKEKPRQSLDRLFSGSPISDIFE
jgi:hypothetical protein